MKYLHNLSYEQVKNTPILYTVMNMKRLILIALILILISPLVLLISHAVHPEFSVGIVLVDDIDQYYGNITKKGFEEYDDYFSAKILPIRFNASEVRKEYKYYLNSDFFKLGNPENLQDEYQVDIILFVTEYRINNWDEDGGAFYGQANTETNSVLMTVHYFNSTSSFDNKVLQHTAVHEVFHIFGYVHNGQDKSGIMQYNSNYEVMELSSFYELQLPIRSIGVKIFPGMSFYFARIAYGMLFSAVLIPFFLGLSLITTEFYNFIFTREKQSKFLPYGFTIIFFLVVTFFGGSYE
jgi:hypothetical protein